MAAGIDPEAMPHGNGGRHAAVILGAADIRPGARVLDVGCGTGDLTLELVERGAHVTALDVSPGMVEVARRRVARFFPDASFEGIAAPAEEAELESGAFDAAVGRYVLHHIDPATGGRSLARALKPGGRACSSRPPAATAGSCSPATTSPAARACPASAHPTSAR